MPAPNRHFAPVSAVSAVVLLLVVLHAPAAPATGPRSAEEPRVGNVEPISPALCKDMKLHKVLTAPAPVGCARLSLVTFRYFGFDGAVHDNGQVVVMDAAAPHVLGIFAKLEAMRFPIAKARLMDRYDGDDDAAMADDNTSAFNGRKIVGGSSISLHAYGLAIDLNPIQNPFVRRAGANLKFDPPAGIEYANRTKDRPWKMLRPGLAESVIDVFADGGFLSIISIFRSDAASPRSWRGCRPRRQPTFLTRTWNGTGRAAPVPRIRAAPSALPTVRQAAVLIFDAVTARLPRLPTSPRPAPARRCR